MNTQPFAHPPAVPPNRECGVSCEISGAALYTQLVSTGLLLRKTRSPLEQRPAAHTRSSKDREPNVGRVKEGAKKWVCWGGRSMRIREERGSRRWRRIRRSGISWWRVEANRSGWKGPGGAQDRQAGADREEGEQSRAGGSTSWRLDVSHSPARSHRDNAPLRASLASCIDGDNSISRRCVRI